MKKLSTAVGVSKEWKLLKSIDPYYEGGKIQIDNKEQKIVCMHEDNIKYIDLNTNEKLGTLFREDEDEGEHELICCFCLNPVANEIVVATKNHLLHHYQMDRLECLRTIRSQHKMMPILAMTYDPTGTLVATGAADKSIRVWDIERGYCTHSFKEHSDIIFELYFHPDPNQLLLISTAFDNTIRCYNLHERGTSVCFKEHVSLVTQISISFDGKLMVSSGRDKVLNFYEMKFLSHAKTVPIMDELTAVVFVRSEQDTLGSPTGKRTESMYNVLTGGIQGCIHWMRVFIRGRDTTTFRIESVFQFTATPNLPNTLLDAESLKSIHRLLYLPKQSSLMIITNDHNLYTISWNDVVKASKIHDADMDKKIHYLTPKSTQISNHGDILDIITIPGTVHMTTDETRSSLKYEAVIISNTSQIRIMNECGNCRIMEEHLDIILSVDISFDGQWIVTASKDHTCRVWHIPTLSCVAVARGHVEAVGSVCMSRNPSSHASRKVFMVSGGADKILKRWSIPLHTKTTDMIELTPTHNVRGHDKDINSLAVSPNDTLVASASQDKLIKLWNAQDLSPVAVLKGHKRGIWKVTFSPVDKILISCCGDRTIKIWSITDFQCVRTLEGHTASVLCVKVLNNGTQLLSGSADGLIRLHTIRTGECETTLDIHTDKVWAIEPIEIKQDVLPMEPDEESKMVSVRMFLSGGGDSRLLLWQDITEEVETNKLKEQEKIILAEQQIQNDVRNKNYQRALQVALELGHSNKVLQIFTTIVEVEPTIHPHESPEFMTEWSTRLDPYIISLPDAKKEALISYVKDWNTTSKHCLVSQLLIRTMIRLIKSKQLIVSKEFSQHILGLLAYSERHYQRLDRLFQSTYLLDYFSSMISLLPMDKVEKKSTRTDGVLMKRRSSYQLPDDEKESGLVIFTKDDLHGDGDDDSEDEPDVMDKDKTIAKETKGKELLNKKRKIKKQK